MLSDSLKAETVIQNANVITIDSRQPRAQALAIWDGKFVAVGSNDEVANLAGPATRVLDLTGKTVLPGFIDAHIHVLNSGIRHVIPVECDLPNISAVQDTLREQAGATPPGEWAQGFKFDG